MNMGNNKNIKKNLKLLSGRKENSHKHPNAYGIHELENILKIYQKRLFKAAFYFSGHQEDAQDIVQETMYIGLNTLEKFRGYSSYYTWLYSIFLNVWKKWKRKKYKNNLFVNYGIPEEEIKNIENFFTTEEDVEKKEKTDLIDKALARLPEKYRVVLVMRHLEEMSYAEISEVLGWSLGTVKTRIYKGRKLLRKLLENIYE